MLHVIMETTLSFIKHILKDSFDFIDRIDTQCTINNILSTCDIKSLYTIIKHDVFYKAIEYWTDKFHDDILLLSRFTKAFILEGLNFILKFNYFYMNKNYFIKLKEQLWEQFLQLLAVIKLSLILKLKCLLCHHKFILEIL